MGSYPTELKAESQVTCLPVFYNLHNSQSGSF